MAGEAGYHHSFAWHFTVYQGKASVNCKQFATKNLQIKMFSHMYISDIVMLNLLPSIKALGNLV